jgi:hypothetical protein
MAKQTPKRNRPAKQTKENTKNKDLDMNHFP